MAINIEVTSEDLSTVQTALESAGHTVEVEKEKPSGEAAETPKGEKPAESETTAAGTGAAAAKEKKEEEAPKAPPAEDWDSLPPWAKTQITKLREKVRDQRDRLEDERAARSTTRQPAAPSETPAEKEAAETFTYCGRPEPKFSDFENAEDPYAELIKAGVKFAKDETKAELQYELAMRQAASIRQTTMAEFAKGVEAAKQIVPDWDEVMDSDTAGSLIPNEFMENQIIGSGIGPYIMLHLARNPDEFHRIAAMNPADTAKAIGRLEVKVEAEVKVLADAKGKGADGKPPEKKEPPKKTASSAPQPETPLRGQQPAGKTLAEIAGPQDRMVDIKFDREYERKRNEQRRGR